LLRLTLQKLAVFILFSPALGLCAGSAPPVGEIYSVETNPGATEAYDRYALTYFGIYTGPPVAHPTRGGTIDTSSLEYDGNQPQNLSNQIKFDFFLSPAIFVGPVLNFQLNPMAGQAFSMLDSGFRVGTNQLFHSGPWTLSGDFRVTFGMRPQYRDQDEILDLQSLQILTYDVPHSKLTLGVMGFHYYQIYGNGIATRDPQDPRDPRDLNLYFAPNLKYQFSLPVAAVASYDFYFYHLTGASWGSWGQDPSDLAMGVSWDITPNINVTPEVLIYPGKLGFDTMSSLVYLSASFL
jgi:hypothetical protein